MKRTICFILTLLLVVSIPAISFAGNYDCDYHPGASLISHDYVAYSQEDSTHHLKSWCTDYYCSICGRNVTGLAGIQEMEPHSFSGNTCTLCGYHRASSRPTPEQLKTEAIQLINKEGDNIIGRSVKILYAGNVRARASKYSADIGSVFVDEEYEIISYDFGTSNSVWLQIKYRNSNGWISATLAQIPDAPSGNGREIDSWCIGRTCRITTSSGRARIKAGTSYPIVEYVGRNEEYTILDIDYAADGTLWYQIQKGGNLCWISSGIASPN